MTSLYSVESIISKGIQSNIDREIHSSLKNELGSAQIRMQQQQQQLSAVQSENVLLRDQLQFLQELTKKQSDQLTKLQQQTQLHYSNSENELFIARQEILHHQELAQRFQRENELLRQYNAQQVQEITRLKAELIQNVRPAQQIQLEQLHRDNFRLQAENDVLAASASLVRQQSLPEDNHELRKRLRERIDRLESGAPLLSLDATH